MGGMREKMDGLNDEGRWMEEDGWRKMDGGNDGGSGWGKDGV